jgi:hypothetical protein
LFNFLKILLSVLLCIFFSVVHSQTLSRKQTKKIPVENNFLLDSLNIVSESVKIFDEKNNIIIDTSFYSVNGISGIITWKKNISVDSVIVEYTTFPFNLSKSFFRKQIKIEQPEEQEFILNPFSYIPSKSAGSSAIDFGNIDYNGSFTRGLSFGNNQDVVLNSGLNLQISGNITDDIEITAALTDNNIPVQPDGNTQQIQEFDKVYIQVGNKHHQIALGDFDAQCLNKYFMRFYKRLQGINYRGNYDLLKESNLTTNTNVALARGKFTRNQLRISEGNQGPYRLIGADGETFIIVLAGTERVYINGLQRQRGADSDYVIDYNTGEITFMPSVIITRDTRVVVEFEYAIRYYFRTILYTANEFKVNNKLKFNLNFYSEQDNKNQPVQDDLTNEQKQVLRETGDNTENAFFRGYELKEYDASRIQYKIFDTTVNGFYYDSVFVFSTNPDSAKYNVVFSDIGSGRGNYIRSSSSANGTVFKWVAPDISGNPQGSYEPITILVTPKREQLLTGGMEFNDDHNKLFIDIGLSNDDANTFAEKGNNDNIGVATRVNYERRFYLNQSEKKDYYISANGYYEFANHNFSPLERYRPVEFTRDWNFLSTTKDIDEHWAGSGIGIVKQNKLKASYNFNTFQKGTAYKGIMHVVAANYNNKGYFADVNFRVVQSEDTLNRALYIWPKIEVAKSFAKLKYWKLGGRYEKEDNKLRIGTSDSIVNRSFLFNDWRVYISSSDSSVDKIKVEYIRRQEFFPKEGEMNLATTSNTYNFTGEWLSKEWQQLRWRLTYRQFENGDSVFTEKKEEQFYLGRIEYNLNLIKGFINLNNLYELGSGREQRRTFSYFEVPAGQGNYIWRDYNENNIQELNEFESVPPGFEDQAKFIKITNPTNEFLPVNITTFNTSLNLNPRMKWHGKTGVKGFISRFSTLTSVQLNRKVFRGAEISPFNPFILSVDDDFLVALNSLVRQSVFFNRSSSVYGIEYTWQDNRNKSSLTNGIEVRNFTEHLTRIRWNVVKSFNVSTKFSSGNKGNTSELFLERNYDIRYYTAEPELTYLFQNKFRASILYKLTNSKNLIGEQKEKSVSHDITNEMRYNIVNKSTINTSFTYALVKYTGGSTNDAIQFAMLNGLQNGSNYLWSVSFDRNISANVQLNLAYDGRKTGNANVVHTGRAQIRAIF